MNKLDLQKLIREEVKKALNEGALLSAIKPGLQGAVKPAVQKLENYLEETGVTLDYKKLGYIVSDIIDAAQHDYEKLRVRG